MVDTYGQIFIASDLDGACKGGARYAGQSIGVGKKVMIMMNVIGDSYGYGAAWRYPVCDYSIIPNGVYIKVVDSV